MNNKPHISVAPMMDWTDRHCRYFHRLIAPNVTLYTEMMTTGALLHGDADRYLNFDTAEHPVALQLGGSDPAALAQCAKMGEEYGYDEINLNCGCPSPRVQKGAFGACLMAEPDLVGECVSAMAKAVSIPVTVKCRIGIDDVDDAPFLRHFINTVSAAGCDTFIIHARKAILNGLSPKENREVPPLRYDLVQKIKADNPALTIILNGGLTDHKDIKTQLTYFDGAMIGRKAYQDPMFLQTLETHIYKSQKLRSRDQIIAAMIPYIQHQQKNFGSPVKSITRHMMGLFNGQPGAKTWKRYLSEHAHKTDDPEHLLNTALTNALQRVKRQKSV